MLQGEPDVIDHPGSTPLMSTQRPVRLRTRPLAVAAQLAGHAEAAGTGYLAGKAI